MMIIRVTATGILVVVLKRLMVRGRNECVAVQLVKHGEQKKTHVIQKVFVLQRAKDIIHIISKLLQIMESELRLNALTINAKQKQLQLDLVKHPMLKFQKLCVHYQLKNHSKGPVLARIFILQVVSDEATVERRQVVK